MDKTEIKQMAIQFAEACKGITCAQYQNIVANHQRQAYQQSIRDFCSRLAKMPFNEVVDTILDIAHDINVTIDFSENKEETIQ